MCVKDKRISFVYIAEILYAYVDTTMACGQWLRYGFNATLHL